MKSNRSHWGKGSSVESININTSKVKASSQPPNSCYGVWDVSTSKRVKDIEGTDFICFASYNDALEGLTMLGFKYWNPEASDPKKKPKHPAYVCYNTLPLKSAPETK